MLQDSQFGGHEFKDYTDKLAGGPCAGVRPALRGGQGAAPPIPRAAHRPACLQPRRHAGLLAPLATPPPSSPFPTLPHAPSPLPSSKARPLAWTVCSASRCRQGLLMDVSIINEDTPNRGCILTTGGDGPQFQELPETPSTSSGVPGASFYYC